MKTLHNLKIKDISLYSILLIFIGNFLMVIGINVFLTPAQLIPTGFTGFSIEISYVLSEFYNISISYNIIMLLLNIPILIFGYFKIGNKFLIKTVISVAMFTLLASIIPTNIQLVEISSSGDKLILAILSGLMIGTGVGLMLKVGASSGGTDIIAVYISIFKGKAFGLYSLLINAIVIVSAFILTQDIIVASLALINLYVTNSVIDTIHNSQEKRILFIITTQKAAVTKSIQSNIKRGITIIDSVGGYSKKENSTLILSISNGEVYQVINLIKEADEYAFINVLAADKIVGNFENPYQKML